MLLSKKSAILALTCVAASEAFSIQSSPATKTCLSMSLNSDEEVSRRNLFKSAAGFSLATISTLSNPGLAFAKGPPTPDELARIRIGYEKLGYLLENFDQETTVCRENGGECKRDADPVRKYLGLRSTTDPLFQIEKVFDKVKPRAPAKHRDLSC